MRYLSLAKKDVLWPYHFSTFSSSSSHFLCACPIKVLRIWGFWHTQYQRVATVAPGSPYQTILPSLATASLSSVVTCPVRFSQKRTNQSSPLTASVKVFFTHSMETFVSAQAFSWQWISISGWYAFFFVFTDPLSCSTKYNAKFWLVFSRSETNLKRALTFVQVATWLANSNLVVVLLSTFFHVLVRSFCGDCKRKRALFSLCLGMNRPHF